jgi:hypothetical protein
MKKGLSIATTMSLKKAWKLIDDACGSLDNATYRINTVSVKGKLPEETVKRIDKKLEMVDFSALVALKNEIEEILEEDKNEKAE